MGGRRKRGGDRAGKPGCASEQSSPTLKVELVSVDKLVPYARNARLHSDEQVASIAGSIREFGFNNPVLIDGEDGIICSRARSPDWPMKTPPTIETPAFPNLSLSGAGSGQRLISRRLRASFGTSDRLWTRQRPGVCGMLTEQTQIAAFSFLVCAAT